MEVELYQNNIFGDIKTSWELALAANFSKTGGFMKLLMILMSFLVANFSFAIDLSDLRKQALEGKTDCNGSVHANDSFGYYANKTILNVVELTTGKTVAQIKTLDPITAIKSDSQNLFILTESNLEIWDIAGQKNVKTLLTYPNISAPYGFYEQPRGLDITNDKIYIAHGSYGVVVFDRNTYKPEAFISTQSIVRDIAINGKSAVVVIDNNVEGGFHGFGFINMSTNQVEKYTPFENVFPESVTISGDTLLVGFFSTIWKYNTQDVMTNAAPKVLGRVFNFPAGLGTIVGKAHYDNKYMYSCYESVDEKGQNPHKHVVAFDRKVLSL